MSRRPQECPHSVRPECRSRPEGCSICQGATPRRVAARPVVAAGFAVDLGPLADDEDAHEDERDRVARRVPRPRREVGGGGVDGASESAIAAFLRAVDAGERVRCKCPGGAPCPACRGES